MNAHRWIGLLRRGFLLGVCCLLMQAGPGGSAQERREKFTRADTLRGMLLPERSCYDVTFYHLDVRIDPAGKTVAGSNTITFRVDSTFDRMQVDLSKLLTIDTITLDGGAPLACEREFDAVHIRLAGPVERGTVHTLRFVYHGQPQEAKNPPWGGGMIWKTDSSGNPWVAVACQNAGALLWWPLKDHQSDEPDSMLISVTAPPGLEDISNGRLRSVTTLADGWRKFDWFVGSPINSYNVTVNIGTFGRYTDLYRSSVAGDTLTLEYYVLPENLERARRHFGENVKPMLEAFERYFGPYPYYRDGYKLIESPHLGMEHQSAVAYGNQYLNGYRGHASSPAGLKFDFIIVHETAHEWWGNSLTSADIADMWIHESFGAYAEALFVEHRYGYEEALRYINGKKQNVGNREPIIGPYNVHREGAGDMYDKGQLVLNTLRSVIGDDSLWFSILRGLQEKYRHRIVTADTIFGYINRRTGNDFGYFFHQYLATSDLPVLEANVSVKGDSVTLSYRWKAGREDFAMPVAVSTAPGRDTVIRPTTAWQRMTLQGISPEEFSVDDERYYIRTNISRHYIDPRSGPGRMR